MSRHILTVCCSILLLSLLGASEADAQMIFARKYRVIAYKAGDPSTYSVSNEVEIIPNMALYVPNAFTPNGDGLNDTWGIAGEAVKELNVQVFNRWGQKIFESDNASYRWDGTYNGEKVQQGAYVYKILAKGASGKSQVKEGNLNVVL